MKPRILILLGGYWPGHDASGPNLSLRAMCEALWDDFEFLMAARDRPFGAREALVRGDDWHDLGFARIRYLEVGRGGAHGLGALLEATPHDVLHLNSFFDRDFTIPGLLHRRLKGLRQPALLSPRGEFSHGALGLRAVRKRVYFAAARAGGLLRGVTLHATSEAELADLQRAFPRHEIRLVTNFRPLFPLPPHLPRTPDQALRVAFLGRISPVKGTDVALRALAMVKRPVRFEIIGPVGDEAYWAECERLIAALPPHVEAMRFGEIPNSEAPQTMARQDVMFMPSRSENFGHAIFEALAAGTPVLIGDKTPWHGLAAKHAGHDVPLDNVARLAAILDEFAAMEPAAAEIWRKGARATAEAHVAESPALPRMRALFAELAGRKG